MSRTSLSHLERVLRARYAGAALSQRYQELIETNAIKEDAGQRSCIERFRALISDLVPYTSAVTGFEVKLADYQVHILLVLSRQASCHFADVVIIRRCTMRRRGDKRSGMSC